MRKLTDPDKQEILKLYRETAETTSTLAERYGVSNSTISRLLKSTLPEDEYEYLVSLKRAARTPEGRAQVSYEQLPLLRQAEKEPEKEVPVQETVAPRLRLPDILPPKQVVEEQLPEEEKEEEFTSSIRRIRRRSSAEEKPKLRPVKRLEILEPKQREMTSVARPSFKVEHTEASVIAQMLGEELLDESEELSDLEDELEEDYDEDYEDEEEDSEEVMPLVARRRLSEAPVQVLPFSAAQLPKSCYLVIDRSSELITRPLKDFGDLGQIPNLETLQKTLPVFDNHRVAKRFSTKRDRVIKVPDSKVLQKASTHLQAKGITRLLIDGQVYSLSMV
ncbi:transposase [Umezakia ovalisporum]|uniref:transposase n=1 Tax=Umezakia ovalisporum TaxID=75695 RepID=UPI002474183F|nr:transposase [Umezakia ovalisporum]MBI1242931.1 transposase [Nostoc sp. RI_552]MDH6085532.1 transposase [Umezakia ovalisporum TAC611]MDH6089178.1 transposase [Umezakia ovalisporum Ak1311]